MWFFRSDKYEARATKLWVSMQQCPLFCRILIKFGMCRQKSEVCPISNFMNIIENTSLMQQDKYIFHLYVFSTCFGRDITHHQELQNCTISDMVIVPREVRRDVVEEIKWSLVRQYYARIGDVKCALHLRRARNIDAPDSILSPRDIYSDFSGNYYHI